jgi:hypothetical protein
MPANAMGNKLRLACIVAYSVAMAYVEAAVVVYLRRIYYPEGFVLTLGPMDTGILRTEIGREVATIVMILGVSLVSYAGRLKRLGAFLLIFGIWDIFYYVFLKILLNWPESFKTKDVLFLIPSPWILPVFLPMSASVLMIGFGAWLIAKE